MELDIASYCGRKIACSCGRTHFCPIAHVIIRPGALDSLPEVLSPYSRIFLAADRNTFAACGDRVCALLKDRIRGRLIFEPQGLLVPDEAAVEAMENAMTGQEDVILGIGSGVINDICKYVSWKKGMEYFICATAPSMDGYASSGAAMIMGGMKVTYTTHPPRGIVADTDVLRRAPMDMIRAGYGDIIGKYSALNDWQLSRLIREEYFCPEIYDLVLHTTDHIRDQAENIAAREENAIADLMKALVLIGITLSLLGSTRPGSGSEHHLSHFFEIVGLVRGEDYFCHGADVAYSTVVTARMREEILALKEPVFCQESGEKRQAAWRRIYGRVAGEVAELQRSAGSYDRDLRALYREKWPQIREILARCPSAAACEGMLEKVGFPLDAFEKMYGQQKIRDAMLYGKDLKDRYSVLWLYYALFSGKDAAGE